MSDENKTRQAFLFLSHLSSGRIIKEFKNIRRSTEHIGDAFFLYDATGKIIPDKISKLPSYSFSTVADHFKNSVSIESIC